MNRRELLQSAVAAVGLSDATITEVEKEPFCIIVNTHGREIERYQVRHIECCINNALERTGRPKVPIFFTDKNITVEVVKDWPK